MVSTSSIRYSPLINMVDICRWEGTIDGTTGWSVNSSMMHLINSSIHFYRFPSNYVDIVHQDGVNSQPQDTLETLDKAPLTKDATIQQYRELVRFLLNFMFLEVKSS